MYDIDTRMRWPRFKSYVVESGRIVPNADDWFERKGSFPTRFYSTDVVAKNRASGATPARAPYLALGDLASLSEDEFERGALDWCNEHGALGILPHMLLTATIPTVQMGQALFFTRTGPRTRWSTEMGFTPRRASAICYLWNNGSPRAVSKEIGPRARNDAFAPYFGASWHEGTPASGGGVASMGDVSKAIPSFELDTEEFWLGYGEPLEAFHEFCWIVKQATRAAEKAEQGEDWPVRTSGLEALRYLLHGSDLDAQLQSRQGVELTVGAVSLAGLLGYMIAEDAAGQRLHICQNEKCRRPFIGNAKTRYCPALPGQARSRCREAAKKRRLRATS